MTTNDDGAGNKGSGKPSSDAPGQKKPTAILDLKATSVGISDAKTDSGSASPPKPASPAAKPGDAKPGDSKSSDAKSDKPAGSQTPSVSDKAAPTGASVPASGTGAQAAKTTTSGSSTPGVTRASSASSTSATSSTVPPTGSSEKAGEGKAAATAATAAAGTLAGSGSSSGSGGRGDGGDKGGSGSGGPAGGPPPSERPSAPAKSGGGLFGLISHLAAGIAGGVLALFALEPIEKQFNVELRPGEAAVIRDLNRRMQALEGQPTGTSAALPGDLASKIAAIEKRIAAVSDLNQSVEAVKSRQTEIASTTEALQQRLADGGAATTGGGQVPAALTSRLSKLEEQLSTLAGAASNGAGGTDLTALAAVSGKVSDLETSLAGQLAELRRGVLQDVETRVTRASETSEAARAGAARVDRELAGAKDEVVRLEQRVEALKQGDTRLQQTVRALQEDATGIRDSLDTLRSELSRQLKTVARPADVESAVGEVAGRIGKLEKDVSSVVENEASRRTSVERVLLALQLGNLKRVVERGAPFAQEYAAVNEAAEGKFDLAALERFKDQGVPTNAALVRDFRDAAFTMIQASNGSTETGLVDQLLAGAKSIVRVRRTDGAAADSSAEAIVARMERALKEDRLADMLAEASKLPDDARKAAKPYLDRVAAVAAVDSAIAKVENDLKSTLRGGAPGKRG